MEKVIRRTYENRIRLVMKYEGPRSGYGREIVVPNQTPKIEAGLISLRGAWTDAKQANGQGEWEGLKKLLFQPRNNDSVHFLPIN